MCRESDRCTCTRPPAGHSVEAENAARHIEPFDWAVIDDEDQ